MDYIVSNPSSGTPTHSSQLASYLLPGFRDLGTFLTSPEILRLCAPDQQDLVRAKQGELAELHKAIDIAHLHQPKLDQKTREGYSRPVGLEMTNSDVRKAYAAAGDGPQRHMRQQYHHEQTLLGTLFGLLPEDMQNEMRAALICQGVANAHWDVLNHRWANTGFYRDGSGAWRVATVDGGNTHSSGFGGRPKVDTADAVLGLPALMSSYLANPIHERDLKPPRNFAAGLGLNLPPGGVPRSDVYASVFHSTLSGMDDETGLRWSPPHCEAAYRLRAFSLRLPKNLGGTLDAQAKVSGAKLGEHFFSTRWDAARKRMEAYVDCLGPTAIDRWARAYPQAALRIDADLGRSMDGAYPSSMSAAHTLATRPRAVSTGRSRAR
ncbi:hypothetical protein [Cupriavidus necator]